MITYVLFAPTRTRRRLLQLLSFLPLALWLVVFALAPSAGAQVDSQVEPFVDVKTLLLLLGLVTPFATAIVARTGISYTEQTAISAFFTAAVAFVYTGLEGGDLTWQKFVNGWVQIGATHLVSWLATKPAVDAVRVSTSGIGFIGPSAEGH